LTKRLTISKKAAALFKGGTDGTAGADIPQTNTYNPDFVLAAMGQISGGAATDYCDVYRQSLSTTVAAVGVLTPTMSSKTKCTFVLEASAAANAPQFSVKSDTTKTLKFNVQWIDYLAVAAASNLLLPAKDENIGNYPTAEGPFFNPFISGFSKTAITPGPFDYDNTAAGAVHSTVGMAALAGTPGSVSVYLK